MVLHTVGTQEEALRALRDGGDGLVVQGVEAGGHLMGVEPALQVMPKAGRSRIPAKASGRSVGRARRPARRASLRWVSKSVPAGCVTDRNGSLE